MVDGVFKDTCKLGKEKKWIKFLKWKKKKRVTSCGGKPW